MSAEQTRDIVVVGASLGGVEALTRLARALPSDFPATVLVVQHIGDSSPGLLAGILDQAGALPSVMAEDGMQLAGGIIVAPPGRHMLLSESGIRVVFGPRENRTRPAIDPLFRTAAVHYRSRVVGVVLTGMLGDGAVGLHAIARCGGVCIVQDPAEAEQPDMPRRALELVPDAMPMRLDDIVPLLSSLVRERAPDPPDVPEILHIEVAITERRMKEREPGDLPGTRTDFTCPDCNGMIHQLDDDGALRFRCRVGHSYSADAFVLAKEQALEDSLWMAQQTLQERAQMLKAMAYEERVRGRDQSADMFDERARESHVHSERLQQLIQQLA